MAKPDDTRIAHASANTSSTNSSPNSNTNSSPLPANTRPADAELIHLLDALRDQLIAAQALPKPPKSARPPRIKPRRRVTVSTYVSTGSNENTPWIRLCGNWLVPAGFKLRTKVRVHVAEGFLLLIPQGES